MSYKREIRGVCDQMDGDWTEDVNEGVHECDLGRSSLVYFNPDETDNFDEPEEVVIREEDNEFRVDPWEIQTRGEGVGSRIVVDGVSGRYYDGYSTHRVERGTVEIGRRGRMTVSEERVY